MTDYKSQRKIANNIRKYFYSHFKDYELRQSGIYGFRNKITEDMYIGSTGATFKSRLSQHIADLTSLNHSNKYLLEAWQNYNYDDFEFVILEVAGNTDSREDLYKKEDKFIRGYIKNGKRLYNVSLNKNSKEMKKDYISRLNSENAKLFKSAKDYFMSILGNTFYDSMIDSAILEEVFSNDTVNVDDILLGIPNMTEHEYNGIDYFLGGMDGGLGDCWEHEDFDMCDCNLVGCIYYDKPNHRCKLYDTDLSEQWIIPRCKNYEILIKDEFDYM